MIVASYALTTAGSKAWRKTVGSRRVTTRAIQSITPGNPISLIESLFGQPVYSHTYPSPTYDDSDSKVEQRLYNARHGWLTVHYREGKVCAFAFMITDRRLRFDLGPTCRGVVTGKLGRVSYDEINPEAPTTVAPFMGPYNWGYTETHYFGRGGNYQHYAFSGTMHGWSAPRSRAYDSHYGLSDISHLLDKDQEWSADDNRRLTAYRRMNAPDTVAVFDSGLDMSGRLITGSGSYDQDDMRNLEGAGPKGWLSRSTFTRREQRLVPWRRLSRSWRLRGPGRHGA